MSGEATAPPPTRRLGTAVVEDGASLRETMRAFATGITVLTTGGTRCHGMTANAVSSLSLDPPLVLCCVSRAARMHDAIEVSGMFAVSMLAGEQEAVARYFTDRRRPVGARQFDAVSWRPGPRTGAPLLSGALAWLECRLTGVHEGGDHSIFVGEVVGSAVGEPKDALVFYGGAYRQVRR